MVSELEGKLATVFVGTPPIGIVGSSLRCFAGDSESESCGGTDVASEPEGEERLKYGELEVCEWKDCELENLE